MNTKIYSFLKLEYRDSFQFPLYIWMDTSIENPVYIVKDVDCLFFLNNDILFENYYDSPAPYAQPSRLVYYNG